MKNKFLKLNKACSENWENMKPNETGNFCDLCSKTVIDFTQLNQYEIAEKMKKADGNICARVTQRQLNSPLLDFETQKNFNLPYSNIAAGLIIATTLATGQPLQAQNQQIQTEIVQTADTVLQAKKNNSESKPDLPKPDDYTSIKGKVTSEEDGTPIKNAKITFVTVKKLFTVHTKEDGTFSFKVPTELIDNDNVIRVSYDEVKKENNQKNHFGYETTDYILTKADINSIYKITATPEMVYLGGIGRYSRVEKKPIVISNGVEIKYNDFMDAQMGMKSRCSLKNKDFIYFESKIAMAIFGKRAQYGLYIITDEHVK